MRVLQRATWLPRGNKTRWATIPCAVESMPEAAAPSGPAAWRRSRTHPFAINRRLLAGGVAVSDAEVFRAMATAFADLKLVIEPGGAAGLAAVLSGRLDIQGRTVVVIASGGNVDRDTYIAALKAGA
jgi:threonine dehydratase